MKNDDPSAPENRQLDQLLARRYRDTTPEFEARWVALKRELRQAPPPRTRRNVPWRFAGWFGVIGAAAAVALVVQLNRLPSRPTPEWLPSPQLAELFAMEAVLGRAVPLLDVENRTALLNLPVSDPVPN
jgi:hypothetical protein